VSLLGLAQARAEVDRLLLQAQDALSDSGLSPEHTQALAALADRIVHRDH
jgi:farnesyl diphosphate synthase